MFCLKAVPENPKTVSNVTFHFEKSGIYENITELRPGDQVIKTVENLFLQV